MDYLDYRKLLGFYYKKRVFITGHTGFKGTWLTHILLSAGAIVTGYSLEPPANSSLFNLLQMELQPCLTHVIGDVRDLNHLKESMKAASPEIVFHLAAQPIVRDSYIIPVDTYATNVMGTVNICECVRLSTLSEKQGGISTDEWSGVRSFLNVTTDKVYRNNEWAWGYRETDLLDGFDPYSNSKSCSELVTHGYKNSFFSDPAGVRVSTARAGNVIGGGDFAKDRIVPDCIRALIRVTKGYNGLSNNLHSIEGGEEEALIEIRNPYSIRPYEHVLEPLFAYLLIAARQYGDERYSGYYNIGPDDLDCVTTGELVSYFCTKWNDEISVNFPSFPKIRWRDISNAEVDLFYEASFLKLDCSMFKSKFGWKPTWHIQQAIDQVISFTTVLLKSNDEPRKIRADKLKLEMNLEIEKFINV